jgi:N-acetylmuramoyl-L-alanine amidase
MAGPSAGGVATVQALARRPGRHRALIAACVLGLVPALPAHAAPHRQAMATQRVVRPSAAQITAVPRNKLPATPAQTAYIAARDATRKLLAQPAAKRRKEAYAACVASLERVARHYPQAYEAPRALFLAGELYRAQYATNQRSQDAEAALARYSRVWRDYPQASLADDAMWARAEIFMQRRDKLSAQRELDQLLQRYPQGDMAPRARAMAQLLRSTLAREAPTPVASVARPTLRQVSLQPAPTPVQRASELLPRRNAQPASAPAPRLRAQAGAEQQAAPTQRRRVVIDPGHGGHDSGAIGPNGTFEKHVVLGIARQVQGLLLAQNIEAILTRSDDTFISLKDRTQLANHMQADAFVSIHANSAPHHEARGIETYTLDTASDRYAVRLAALENKTSEKEVTDLQLILADLSTKANSHDSVLLARGVQKKMVQAAQRVDAHARDLGVKASLFYVLLGARMPSILVETAFVSNALEERLLQQPAYQRRLGQAIADAVLDYLHSVTQPPTF